LHHRVLVGLMASISAISFLAPSCSTWDSSSISSFVVHLVVHAALGKLEDLFLDLGMDLQRRCRSCEQIVFFSFIFQLGNPRTSLPPRGDRFRGLTASGSRVRCGGSSVCVPPLAEVVLGLAFVILLVEDCSCNEAQERGPGKKRSRSQKTQIGPWAFRTHTLQRECLNRFGDEILPR